MSVTKCFVLTVLMFVLIFVPARANAQQVTITIGSNGTVQTQSPAADMQELRMWGSDPNRKDLRPLDPLIRKDGARLGVQVKDQAIAESGVRSHIIAKKEIEDWYGNSRHRFGEIDWDRYSGWLALLVAILLVVCIAAFLTSRSGMRSCHQIDGLTRDLREPGTGLFARMAATQGDVTVIQRTLAGMQPQVGLIPGLVSSGAAVQSQVGLIQHRVDDPHSGLNRLRTDADTIRTDVGLLRTDANALRTDANALRTDTDTMRGDYRTLLKACNDHEAQTDAFAEEVAPKLTNLRFDVNDAEARVAILRAEVDALIIRGP